MISQIFIEGFKNSKSGNNQKDGERILRNDLVTDLKCKSEGNNISIETTVISENLFSEYSCSLLIEKNNGNLLKTSCTCDDFDKNSSTKHLYCCKHLTAAFCKFIYLLENDDNIAQELGLNKKTNQIEIASQSSILDFLLGEDKQKEKIKFEIILNKLEWSDKIAAEFKIGSINLRSNKLYTIKNIDSFLIAIANRIAVPYGKEFTFDLKKQKLSSKDKNLIKFIELIKEMDLSSNSFKRNSEKLVSGKQIIIPKYLLKEFLTIAKDFRVYLGSSFYSRELETEIVIDKIPIPLELKEVSEMVKLEAPNGLPASFGLSDQVFLYNTLIYIPPQEQIDLITPYIEAFSHVNTVFFSIDQETRILEKLVPSLQKVTTYLTLSENLLKKVVIAPVKFKFYFDKQEEIVMNFLVCYGEFEINYFDTFTEKVIYRDNEKEEGTLKTIRRLGFEPVNGQFMFFKDESYIFDFFKNDIKVLQDIGEVFYSERFKGIKNLTKGSFKAKIKKAKYDYFEMNFKIKDILPDETTQILRSFRESKKYFKLKSGEFLDLEEIELKSFLKLLDSLNENDDTENGTIYFNPSRAMAAADYIKDKNIDYIQGSDNIIKTRNMLSDLKSEKFKVPENINATLRQYQKEGYSFLKSIDYLGFGAILGDQMGLGKTLQAITFIASDKGSKTLIVAPTSLIYNWLSEFNKFAKDIKALVVSGTKRERQELLNGIDKYDVFITTYNLLKRDINEYQKIDFTYCFLDEAQNIKNPSSQNAIACKKIKAKTRFALTGTPIENSLMELWSIFDFIMPKYLYSQKKFETRYFRRLEEDDCIIEDLNTLIKPFILRRYKKDVLEELPDKIEKKLIIPMNKEQTKVYKTYADYAKSLIENKVKDQEFKNSKIEILSYITKLRQICLDPSVVMDNYKGTSSKIEYLIELLSQTTEEGHKVLLFSQFTSVLKNIGDELTKNDIKFKYLDGSTNVKMRMKLVNEFNQDNTPVFLISLKAGGTGLNLTSADVVIHFDPWWNPAVEEQATDRAHRIGQKNVVEVIKMVSQGTIEEKIISLQEQKKDLINKVIGDETDISNIITNLNENDIIGLFDRY